MYSAAWCAGLGFLSFTFQPYTEGRLLSKAQWLRNGSQGFQLSQSSSVTHKTSRKASMSLWSFTKPFFVCPWSIKQHISVVSPELCPHRSCGNAGGMEGLGVSEGSQRGTAHKQKMVSCSTDTPRAISRKVFTSSKPGT